MQTMISRIYAQQVRDKLSKFPAVAILGPRQCGKTTLARQFDGAYFDMETEGSQARLDAEWDTLAAGKGLVVIDESQQAPKVFSRLRGAIDARRKRNGRFLLLGSVSPELMKNVSESLAGRLGLVRLAPEMFPQWQEDYLDTLVTRDLPTWGLSARPRQTMRLLAMLAAMQGQPLNASQLGASLALDHKTVLSHCDFLEGAFLVRRLPPFFTNVKKRLVKTPRLFWRDSGLLHALMNVADLERLYRQPWLGHSWEGFIIEQTLATIAAVGKRAQAFFFRTSDGYELDLVLDWGDKRWAVEIKLTSNPSPDMIARLNTTADMIGASRRILVCRCARPIEGKSLLVANPATWLKNLVE
jgi:predicted AAA+ superfamily ATPase